jgi:hypothetical protein
MGSGFWAAIGDICICNGLSGLNSEYNKVDISNIKDILV